ncbi:MAG: hypothetical protein Q8L74_16625 [Nitrospirota bacterium]|nr:hypothetical protein [Nitrospirota bacterium]MDP2384549.1 hypothetical protein [Nitrospirota bacterium]MDP3597606.1 hypothetical protein [Nitrospirota bacterium]
MTEQNRTENKTGNISYVAETAQAITLAATVAMLGLSLGVDVPQLLAASPGEMAPSNQFKIDGTQMKEKAVQHKLDSIQQKDNAIQEKLNAVQEKHRANPGMRPATPIR